MITNVSFLYNFFFLLYVNKFLYQAFQLDPVKEFLIIPSLSEMTAGSDYVLNIDFKGAMDTQIVGLYSSTYMDANGDPR